MRKKILIITAALAAVLCISASAYAGLEDPMFTYFIDKTCLTEPEKCTPGSTVDYQLQVKVINEGNEDRIEYILQPEVEDIIPEGLEFMGEEYVDLTSQRYGEESTFNAYAKQEGSKVTFQISDDWDEEEHDYYMETGDLLTITYKCKIGDYVKVGTDLTNTATFYGHMDDDADPGTNSETITVVDPDNPVVEPDVPLTEQEEDYDDEVETGDESLMAMAAFVMAAALSAGVMVLRRRDKEGV